MRFNFPGQRNSRGHWSAGTLMWAGLANSYFWVDRSNGIGGAYLSQLLPFADEKSMGLFFELERAVYQSLS